jgi:hypothetical protein
MRTSFIFIGMLLNDVRTGISGPAVHVQGNVEEALQVLHRLSGITGHPTQGSMASLLNSSNRVMGHGTLHRCVGCSTAACYCMPPCLLRQP